MRFPVRVITCTYEALAIQIMTEAMRVLRGS